MSTIISLEHTTEEALLVYVTTPVDATASDIEFNLTAASETTPGATWLAGTWHADGWSSTTGKAKAYSPVLNVAAGFDLVEAESFKLWARPQYGTERPVHLAATIRAT